MSTTNTPMPQSDPRPAGDPTPSQAPDPALNAAGPAPGQGTAGPAPAPAPSTDRRTVAPRNGTRWGRISLILGLVALIGGMGVAALVGFTIAPQEAEAGRYLGDTPEGYQTLVTAAFASFILWGLTALAAMVTGVVALVRRERPGRAIAGLLIAFVAPALWFGAFAISALIIASTIS
ncbi:hypothetical protein [Brachybacterium sp. p3-SID957]|uniref:hypothetical protein n=1 Tax=Brachybacterium sp. p3-SID957 TaxID=2916049 RepID=UPI00223AD2B5|nr:hypothetical protein [Brachybacterium sp. p3-SID957]MCT1775775.1 hypothetical protein [Brachybacterium sp. p3-SID957]